MAQAAREQRRFPRIPSRFHVLVRREDNWDDETFTRTEDVGLGGCLFSHPKRFEAGDRLFMAIAVRERIVEVGARVVYVLAREDGGFDTGVEFTHFRPADRPVLAELFVDLETRPGVTT